MNMIFNTNVTQRHNFLTLSIAINLYSFLVCGYRNANNIFLLLLQVFSSESTIFIHTKT